MPVFRRSRSSKHVSGAPLLKASTPSRLNVNIFSSTTSISSFLSASQSSRSLLMSSLRGLVHGKENSSPGALSPGSTSPYASRGNSPTVAYPEISAPTLTPEALSAVKDRYKLIPLSAAAADENLTRISRGSASSSSQDTDTASIQTDRRSETSSIKRVEVPPIMDFPIETSGQNFSHSVLGKV